MALTTFRLSEDLSPTFQVVVILLVLLTVGLLSWDLRRRPSGAWLVWLSGALGALALAAAVLRPTWVTVSGKEAAPRVLALLDGSHRLSLRADSPDETRREVAGRALSELEKAWPNARLEALTFGEGLARSDRGSHRVMIHSDLMRSLSEAIGAAGEKPRAVVVISDGRLATPGAARPAGWEEALGQAASGVPIHTVAAATASPRDRSIFSVGTTGTALAHQAFRLRIEVACEPSDLCSEAEVVVRELLEARPPVELARGTARPGSGLSDLELEVTLERAGARVIEVALAEGVDEIVHNDRRLIPIEVRRDRTRILHVAGRPTYDVRALRSFLKSDESIDLISFFILRTEDDDAKADQDELALIPFPVDELFTEHLPSFDAVVLQDIDARRYKLNRHFASIHQYVMSGGGLILVGGPAGFSAGGYAGGPIEDVLPVSLPPAGDLVHIGPFAPRYTQVGAAAPMLRELQQLLLGALPEMSGYNVIGAPKPGSLVLWEHPEEMAWGAQSSLPMPLLALGEVGDGRSIALAVDGTHKLRFGRLGVQVAGEAHGALWEGLLGWLMRDPRFEAASARLDGPCIQGYPTRLVVTTLPGIDDDVKLKVAPLGQVDEGLAQELAPQTQQGLSRSFELSGLEPGAYAARVSVGSAPPTRLVFACEVGGEAHADTRPDPERLRAIAQATGGTFREAGSVHELPPPGATFVATQRSTRPIVPAWVWSLTATALLAAHWLLRRAAGFP